MFLCAGMLCAGFAAWAVDFETVKADDYGYAIKIPEGFELQGKMDKTSSWISHAVATEGKETKKKKGFGLNVRVKGISVGGSKSEESTSTGEGSDGQAALMVYVNWVYMPDVSSKQMYDVNKKSMQDKIDGPNPDYTDLKELKLKDGYGFWYKEVDKSDGGEIHRWHINAYGNKSAYTVGLTGTFAQFDEWAKTYEEVIKSFEFIPLKG